MAVQTLPGATTNFTFSYDDLYTGARERAVALQQSCENDLALLEQLFGFTGGFGTSNQVQVRVSPNAGLGSNNGYRTGGQSLVLVNPFSTTTLAADADAGARAVFVAEFAEVLMAYRNRQTGTTTWNAGDSAGEGLSAVCAMTLYPDAWYNPALGLGPRTPQWMQSNPRPYNWISQSQGTDAIYRQLLHDAANMGPGGQTGTALESSVTDLEPQQPALRKNHSRTRPNARTPRPPAATTRRSRPSTNTNTRT
jgi:hypothetical protein